MNDSISGHHKRLMRRKWISLKIGHPSSCLFHNVKSGCAVPRLQIHFIKSVKPPGRNPAEVNGGGAESPHRNTSSDEALKNLQRSIGHIQVCIRKAGNEA